MIYLFPGIISKVFENGDVVKEALKLGKEISSYSLPALISCKDAISKGIRFYEVNIINNFSRGYYAVRWIGLRT